MVGGGSGSGSGSTPTDAMAGLRFTNDPSYIRGPTWLQLPLLNAGALGVQCIWSVEMAWGMPFLLELGLSKAAMSLVFIAGPISGFVVQPIIGILADRSTHPWGRRRPYLLVASVACALFVLLLGFSRSLAKLLGIEGATAYFTILGIWGLDFAVNAVMALDRSLVLDMVPADQQADANAWAARIFGVGAIFGFYVGDINLAETFPFSWMSWMVSSGTKVPSEPQVRCLSLLTAFWMIATHAAVAWAAIERRLEPIPEAASSAPAQLGKTLSDNIRASARQFLTTVNTLSDPIKAVFGVQIMSWIAWFPMMFYTTEWISNTYTAAYMTGQQRPLSEAQLEELRAQGTRAGSHALFLQAILSFACSIVLPLILPSPETVALPSASLHYNGSGLPGPSSKKIWLSPQWLPPGLQALVLGLRNRLGRSRIRSGISLTTLWTAAHFLLAAVTWLTWPVSAAKSVYWATFIICVAGYSWAATSWIPFTLLGIFLQSPASSSSSSLAAGQYETIAMSEGLDIDDGANQGRHPNGGFTERSDDGDGDDEDDEEGANLFFDPRLSQANGHVHSGIPSPSPSHRRSSSLSHNPSEQSSRAGTILGLHNIAIVIPQLLVSITASVIFSLFEPTSYEDDSSSASSGQKSGAAANLSQNDAVGIVFRLGGLTSLVAAWLTIRLGRRYGRVILEGQSQSQGQGQG